MLRFVVFLMAMVTLSGILVLLALTLPLGLNNATGVIGSVAIGTALAIPVSIIVAKAMMGNQA
ncbi:MAG: hypothetical protein OQK24_08010 [Magnetovibrio sp.]|nr:hypothetical protein [Magnetovibrio sp.]